MTPEFVAILGVEASLLAIGIALAVMLVRLTGVLRIDLEILRADVSALRSELKGDIDALRTELKGAALRGDIRTGLADRRTSSVA
ncbi:MAG: hypothetical protein OXQ94_01535 [Gemmatimonadota bacterium]|nr:hypothetical protein [Gemmatimonadota bacterium]MDE2870361.1 hypothetical protein [Gemmatimonadota bacterium]